MAKAVAQIVRSTNNGPFIYIFEVNEQLQNAAVGVATLGASLDAVKTLMAGVPGTVKRVVISMVTVE